MRGTPIQLPPCGMFIGSGVYPMSKDYCLSTLVGHPAWAPQTFTPEQMIDMTITENQGNLIQLWGYARGYAPAMIAQWIYGLDQIGITLPDPNWETGEYTTPQDAPELKEHRDRRGAGFVHFTRLAATRGLYTVFIYTDATPQWAASLKDLGEHYLGYDFGERFTFSLDNPAIKNLKPEDVTLEVLADDLIQRVREHVDQKRAAGWGNIYATSSNFHIDYEVVAGTDIPLIEDFAFRHLNIGSALSRGMYRQFELPMWGSHMAHEHYSWIPAKSEYKFPLLTMAMQQKYMAGCKMIINESGTWFVEASLCEDSPKFDFPRMPLKPGDVAWGGKKPLKFIPYIEEARKHYPKIDHTSWYCREYRRVMSEFYDFVKAHGTPAGQPETTLAIAKGNYDLANHRFSTNNAIAGTYALADRNAQWYEGAPEYGWEIVKEVFYPLRQVMAPYPNHFVSGTPYGQVDVVTFCKDEISAEFLTKNYKALLFSAWNTASDKQYDVLKQYVHAGGTLFISIPHLSTNVRRNYGSYTVDELINRGDFSELCGVKVKQPGERFWWAMIPDGSTALGLNFPRRFGIMSTRMGDIEITDPAAEVLITDDEQGHPFLLRRQYGKGTVYFLNSWAYPGALNTDEGPGGRTTSKGMIGTIFQHIANQHRGNVYITDDGTTTGPACDHVAFSYFPEAGKICLQNVDFQNPRTVTLHAFGKAERLTLEPAQFILRDSVKATT